MENASKALIMAAAVLIAILVLSLIVYLYSTFSQAKRDNIELMNNNQLIAFNGKYFAYDGRKDLTYYDIANIATMAKNDNKNNDLNITVTIGGSSTIDLASTGYKDMMNKLSSHSTIDDSSETNPEIMKPDEIDDPRGTGKQPIKVLVNYTCNVNIGDKGMISNINFTKNSM